MRSNGGLFLGLQLRPKGDEDKRKIIRQYGVVWGFAIRDADDVTRKKRNVSFLVKYDEEPNPRWGQKDAHGRPERKDRPLCVRCFASGRENISTVMSAIERGDFVVCFGRVRSETEKTKKRGDMWFRTMNTAIVIPMGLIGFLIRLYNSRGINDILDAEDNAAPDEWEE